MLKAPPEALIPSTEWVYNNQPDKESNDSGGGKYPLVGYYQRN